MVDTQQHTPLFGTDGIRGKAGQAPMDAPSCLHIAMSAAHVMSEGTHRHRVLIGKDTRRSCYMIENALSAGFIAMGMEVIFVGPLPTPAVAMLTRHMRCDIGVMISASHNPYDDNGIKFFGKDGQKIGDDLQQKIEQVFHHKSYVSASCDNMGEAYRLNDADGRYIEFLKSHHSASQLTLDGLKIVVDCAHGAGYKIAPKLLWELGAQVVSIFDTPNGVNINLGCGATDTQALSQRVLDEQADIGIALDGDGDRLMLIDERGAPANGDHILAALATFYQKEHVLPAPYVVGTHMSNLGLERYLDSLGIEFLRADVGDRHVCRLMREKGAFLGGESSGHIIIGNDGASGDGLRTALAILTMLAQTKQKASELLHLFEMIPQKNRNISCANKHILDEESVRQAVRRAQEEISGKGRLLVRPSGTENCIRITAQSDNIRLAEAITDKLARTIGQYALA